MSYAKTLSESQLVTLRTYNSKTDFGQQRFFSNLIANLPDNNYIYLTKLSRGKKPIQEALLVSDVRKSLAKGRFHVCGDDMYVSVNGFRDGSSRTNMNVSNYNCLYVDIDYKSVRQYANYSAQKMKDMVINHCDFVSLPAPTQIVSSGNGLHLYWLFDNPLIAMYGKSWSCLEKFLCTAFAQFGADSAATDAARILRIPGTNNTKQNASVRTASVIYEKKSNRYVEPIRMHKWACDYKLTQYCYSLKRRHPDQLGDCKIYRIKSLLTSGQFVPDRDEAFEPYPDFEADKNYIEREVQKVKRPYTLRDETPEENAERRRKAANSIPFRRVSDIEHIVISRDGKVTGYRHNILLFYAKSLQSCGRTFEEVLSAGLALNAKFKEPLDEKDAHNTIYRGFTLFYMVRNDTIISKLGITKKEEFEMHTIFGREEKRRRRIERNKFKMSLAQRTDYFIKRIVRLLEAGTSISEIARILKISRSTVYNYIDKYHLREIINSVAAKVKYASKGKKPRDIAKAVAKEAIAQDIQRHKKVKTAVKEEPKALTEKQKAKVVTNAIKHLEAYNSDVVKSLREFIEEHLKTEKGKASISKQGVQFWTTPEICNLIYSLLPASGAIKYGKASTDRGSDVLDFPLLAALAA